MLEKRRDTYKRNSVEAMADSDKILCLNEKHIEKGLDHKICEWIRYKIMAIEIIDKNW